MSKMPDKEFERLAVLHAMGALSGEEAERFRAAREERGQEGDRLVQGVERAFAGAGPGAPPAAAPVASERADLAAVTGRPIEGPRRGPWIAAIVVLLALAGGAVAWALSLRSELDRTRAESAAATHRVEALTAAVAERDTVLAAVPDAAELAPLLASEGLRVVPLTGGGESSARLLAGDPGSGAILVATGLPEGGGPYRLVRETSDGASTLFELGTAPSGFLFSVFPDATFLDDARTVRLVAPSADATAPDTTVLEGRVPR